MLFDAHFHITRLPNTEFLLKSLEKIGYFGETSACTPQEWEKQILLLKNSKHLNQCIGIHPEIVSKISSKDLTNFQFLLENHPEISIGECGLDKRFSHYENNGLQEKIFRLQLQLAHKLQRKVVIHCVGDYGRLIKILKEELSKEHPIYFHRYAGSPSVTKDALYFNASFGNPKHSEGIPSNSIKYETDADENFIKEGSSIEEITDKLTTKLKTIQDQYHQ